MRRRGRRRGGRAGAARRGRRRRGGRRRSPRRCRAPWRAGGAVGAAEAGAEAAGVAGDGGVVGGAVGGGGGAREQVEEIGEAGQRELERAGGAGVEADGEGALDVVEAREVAGVDDGGARAGAAVALAEEAFDRGAAAGERGVAEARAGEGERDGGGVGELIVAEHEDPRAGEDVGARPQRCGPGAEVDELAGGVLREGAGELGWDAARVEAGGELGVAEGVEVAVVGEAPARGAVEGVPRAQAAVDVELEQATWAAIGREGEVGEAAGKLPQAARAGRASSAAPARPRPPASRARRRRTDAITASGWRGRSCTCDPS